MSYDQYVSYIAMERMEDFELSPDEFTLTPERGWMWLQRCCLWILAKLRCHSNHRKITYRRYDINTGEVMKQLVKQRADLVNWYHRGGKRLLIGSDDFHELMGSIRIEDRFSFVGHYHWQDKSGPRLMDMNITVIPWMRGILVVPDDL